MLDSFVHLQNAALIMLDGSEVDTKMNLTL
jgi:hypothetical protein